MAKAAAAARFSLLVLLKMCVRWWATVFSLIFNSRAISPLVSPLATRRNTSTSRAVSPAGYVDAAEYVDDELEAGAARGAIIALPFEVMACSGVIARPAFHVAAKSFSPR